MKLTDFVPTLGEAEGTAYWWHSMTIYRSAMLGHIPPDFYPIFYHDADADRTPIDADNATWWSAFGRMEKLDRMYIDIPEDGREITYSSPNTGRFPITPVTPKA